ncbi:MAG: hypothetical protein QOF62_3279 [Pyrinomonadaceae bacterium]|nr:hypothetical protein [Pyrinomonadaceae bacterium]
MCGGGSAPPSRVSLRPGYALCFRIYLARGRIKGVAHNQETSVRRGIAAAAHRTAKPKRHQRVGAVAFSGQSLLTVGHPKAQRTQRTHRVQTRPTTALWRCFPCCGCEHQPLIQTLRCLDPGIFRRHLHWRAVGPVAFTQATAADGLKVNLALRLLFS